MNPTICHLYLMKGEEAAKKKAKDEDEKQKTR